MGRMKELLNTFDGEDEKRFNLTEIAMNKAWIYIHEYDPTSGREVEKQG